MEPFQEIDAIYVSSPIHDDTDNEEIQETMSTQNPYPTGGITIDWKIVVVAMMLVFAYFVWKK